MVRLQSGPTQPRAAGKKQRGGGGDGVEMSENFLTLASFPSSLTSLPRPPTRPTPHTRTRACALSLTRLFPFALSGGPEQNFAGNGGHVRECVAHPRAAGLQLSATEYEKKRLFWRENELSESRYES